MKISQFPFPRSLASSAHLSEHGQAQVRVKLYPAELILRCGLRRAEVAGLRGSDVNKAALLLRIKGKGGKIRYCGAARRPG